MPNDKVPMFTLCRNELRCDFNCKVFDTPKSTTLNLSLVKSVIKTGVNDIERSVCAMLLPLGKIVVYLTNYGYGIPKLIHGWCW